MSGRQWIRDAILVAPRPIRYVAVNTCGYRLARRRYGGDFAQVLASLELSQWKTAQELRAGQEERLRTLIEHAYHNVPYYRETMDERGLRPRDIATIDDLRKLPFLTKEIINERFEDLKARGDLSRAVPHGTSGTTGVKLRRFLLPTDLLWARNYADLYRAYRWAGFERGDRRATIAGRWFAKRPPYRVVNHFDRQLLLSAHHLGPETAEEYVRAIERYSPRAVQGHPSAVAFLAQYLVGQKRTLPVTCILTTGEQLFPDQRSVIERAFAANVFDGWGQGENVGRAYECERHEGYHVSSEFGILEIDPAPELSDGLGEIVATSLHNDVMPFIRYRTGDLAAWADAPCSCGRGLPLIRDLVGRIDDVIEDTEGRPVLPVSIRTRLSRLRDLVEYQLVQTEDEYHITCVVRGTAHEATLAAVGEALLEILGRGARLRVESLEAIPRTRGGKTQLVVDRRGNGGTWRSAK